MLGGLASSLGCVFYVMGRSFAAYAVGELCFACGTALVSGADTALLYDAFAADGRAMSSPARRARSRPSGSRVQRWRSRWRGSW